MLYRSHTVSIQNEASSWVFTLVVTLNSKLRKNYEVTKYFTVQMAARGKG